MEVIFNINYFVMAIILIVAIFILARVYNDKLNFKKDIHFKDKDVEITSEAFKKIGEVKDGTTNEIILNMQNVENNKEIQANNEAIENLEKSVEFLLNENGKLRAEYSILRSRFDALTKAVGRVN